MANKTIQGFTRDEVTGALLVTGVGGTGGGGGGTATTVQDEGVALPAEGAINFIGPSVAAADDAANGRTNVIIDPTSLINSAVATHEADTTNVHGIADTSKLALRSELVGGSSGHPSLLAACNPTNFVGTGAMAANQLRAVRNRVGKTGTLHELAIWVGTSSGNIEVFVFDSAQPRNKLYSTGPMACPAASSAGGWRVVGDANVPVNNGDELDVGIWTDNATATFGRVTVFTGGIATFPSSAWLDGLGGQGYLLWQVNGTSVPATLDDTTFGNTGACAAIIGRIA